MSSSDILMGEQQDDEYFTSYEDLEVCPRNGHFNIFLGR